MSGTHLIVITSDYFLLVGYLPESEASSYQSDDSVDVIDTTPEQSSDRIVATKLPEVQTLPTTENKPSESSAEQPARVSGLELENKLLRKEVDSLNSELLSLAKRSKEAQESNVIFENIFFRLSYPAVTCQKRKAFP